MSHSEGILSPLKKEKVSIMQESEYALQIWPSGSLEAVSSVLKIISATQDFAFTGRSGQAFHMESGACEPTADLAFGAVSGQYGSGSTSGHYSGEDLFTPQLRLSFGRESIEIDEIDRLAECKIGQIGCYLVQREAGTYFTIYSPRCMVETLQEFVFIGDSHRKAKMLIYIPFERKFLNGRVMDGETPTSLFAESQ